MKWVNTGLLISGLVAMMFPAGAIAAEPSRAIVGLRSAASTNTTVAAAEPTRLSQGSVAVDYRIPALQKDFTGSLWISTWRAQIARINPETGGGASANYDA
jgi:hypothetical protein